MITRRQDLANIKQFSRLGALLLAMSVLGSGCGDNDIRWPTADGALLDGGPDASHLEDAAAVCDARWPGAAPGPLPCEDASYYSPVVSRFAYFQIAVNGLPGSGLDVDSDPATCHPAGICSDGIDNQMASLWVECTSTIVGLSNINQLFEGLFTSPQDPLVLLTEARGLVREGNGSDGPFELRFLSGGWVQDQECDIVQDLRDASKICRYTVRPTLFETGTCDPFASFDNAEIIDAELFAGGDDHRFFVLLMLGESHFGVSMHRARLEADVVFVGEKFYLVDGILAGALCPWDFANLIYSIFPEDPSECNIEALLPDPDIEAGCSAGEPDAISVGITFSTVPAEIVGFQVPD